MIHRIFSAFLFNLSVACVAECEGSFGGFADVVAEAG
jgi:hypothetical protein